MYIVYDKLQVGTIIYLMITDNSLILHLEISAYTAYTGYSGGHKIMPLNLSRQAK